MNKRQIIASLNNIANKLDIDGLYKEAEEVTEVMKRLSGDNKDDYSKDDDFDKKYKDNKEISLLDTLIDEDYERSRNKKFKKFPYKGNKDITLLDRRYDKPKIKN